jgi:hypothetical protein
LVKLGIGVHRTRYSSIPWDATSRLGHQGYECGAMTHKQQHPPTVLSILFNNNTIDYNANTIVQFIGIGIEVQLAAKFKQLCF